MATLNSSNIVNGNVVETTDILQLYDALTAGGGTTGVYDVSISGSLTGSATTALNASKLNPDINASTNANYNVLFAATSSAAYEEVYKENGTIMTYNPSTNLLTVTASRAVTASYASFALSTPDPTYLNALTSNSGSAYIGVLLGVVAGSLTAAGGIAQTPVCDPLKGKVIGSTLFINATIFGPGGLANSVGVRSYNAGTGQIEFQTGGGSGTEFIMFTAHYKPA